MLPLPGLQLLQDAFYLPNQCIVCLLYTSNLELLALAGHGCQDMDAFRITYVSSVEGSAKETTHEPVSYTHLDVYKRQSLGLTDAAYSAMTRTR